MSYDVINGRIPYLDNHVPVALSSHSPPPRELWEQGCQFGIVTAYHLKRFPTNTLLPILNYQN